jgi:hypothetical protein
MMYVEYSTSAGHGTLVEHGVIDLMSLDDDLHDVLYGAAQGFTHSFIAETITLELYSDFIEMHGSTVAT